ncbi:hypothetical protein [Roseovarius nitratireducens]|uniref:hypothetical protein n=1 Tax=Roseovarius nitratireducens TaxID=2044597 RepID=UPI00197F3AD5|nr:hypothetical protein [Roseovarius nitratireducens]
MNRMRARVQNGYWVFQAPVGYRYERVSGQGKVLVRDAWDIRLAQAYEASKGLKANVKQLEMQIDQLLDRIVDASNGSVVSAYEKRIAKLEREKVLAEEQLAQSGKPRHTFEESFEHAMRFLSSLWKRLDKFQLRPEENSPETGLCRVFALLPELGTSNT